MVNSNSVWKFTAVLVEIQLSRLGGGGGWVDSGEVNTQ